MRTAKLLCVVSLAIAGCAPTVQSAARQASKAAVKGGAQKLAEPGTQEAIAAALKDPGLQQAVKDLTEHAVQGGLSALHSDPEETELTATVQLVTQAAAHQLVATLNSPRTRAELTGLARAVTDAAFAQAAADMQSELRPVVRAMLQDDVAVALAGALRGPLQPELGRTAQNVAYRAMVGANSGLGAAWTGQRGFAGEARSASRASRVWLWGGLGLFGLLALMLASGAVMMVASVRRARAEVARLESATLLLATAMRERQQNEQSDEVVAIVQEALSGRAEQTGRHRLLGALRMRKSA